MDRKRLRALHEIAGYLSRSTGFGVVHLYKPDAVTEVHADASKLDLGGILLPAQSDERLHPVAYYSRQTTDGE
nr:unnamed protein product [Callosobruchus analis]